jgi:integrase
MFLFFFLPFIILFTYASHLSKPKPQDDNNNVKLTTLKNSSSYRTIKIDPDLVRELKKFKMKQNELILQIAGVDYKGTHGFRHTHAVLLLESGASLKYVSNHLGHKTIKTTADTYLDITEKIEEDELQKFASYTKR